MMEWAVEFCSGDHGDEELDLARLDPIVADLTEKYGAEARSRPANETIRLVFDPTAGIPPFWPLRR